MRNIVLRSNGHRPLSVFDEMDRIMNRVFETDLPHDGLSALKGSFPVVDVVEGERSYDLEAELPGLSEKDVEVKVEANLLTISSVVEKTEEKKDEQKNYLIRERRTREFTRSFKLPADVNSAEISASFKNGVLHLSIPKAEKALPKKIDIVRID